MLFRSQSTVNHDVTIRFRDDMGQIRVAADCIAEVIGKYLEADIKTANSTLVPSAERSA